MKKYDITNITVIAILKGPNFENLTFEKIHNFFHILLCTYIIYESYFNCQTIPPQRLAMEKACKRVNL